MTGRTEVVFSIKSYRLQTAPFTDKAGKARGYYIQRRSRNKKGETIWKDIVFKVSYSEAAELMKKYALEGKKPPR